MPLLRVFVNELKIPPDSIPKAGSYFLQLRVGCYCTKGKPIKLNKLDTEQEISLDDEMCIDAKTLKSCLTVELHREKVFSQSQEIAAVQTPLCYVNHSSQRAEPRWYQLESTDDTTYQILMDVRFDLPPDISSNEKDALDGKLQQLNRILEKEVKQLEEQSRKLASGSLAPPLLSNMEDDMSERAFYFEAHESYSLTSADSKEDLSMLKDTNKTRAQEQWEKIRYSVPFLLRMKSEVAKDADASVDSITGQQTLGSEMIDTAAHQKLSQMKCFQNIDKFEGRSLDSGGPPKKRMTSKKYSGNSRSYSTIIREPRLTGLDDQLKKLVYRKTVQALIYPASDPNAHQFETWSAKRPTKCSECGTFLLGIARQGVKCRACGRKCHKRCATLVNADCPMANAQHSQSLDVDENTKGISLSLIAISNKMKRTAVNNSSSFHMLRDAFGVSEKEHVQIQSEVESIILDSVTNFNAVIKVKVVSVHNLRLKEEGLHPAVYVSVSVASSKRITSTYKDQDEPVWDEEFHFDCHSSLDKIKIRVWNKVSSPLAKLSHKLTKESDYFLGQKVIEARMLGGPMDVWYKLGMNDYV